jgi:hypothetical protein
VSSIDQGGAKLSKQSDPGWRLPAAQSIIPPFVRRIRRTSIRDVMQGTRSRSIKHQRIVVIARFGQILCVHHKPESIHSAQRSRLLCEG